MVAFKDEAEKHTVVFLRKLLDLQVLTVNRNSINIVHSRPPSINIHQLMIHSSSVDMVYSKPRKYNKYSDTISFHSLQEERFRFVAPSLPPERVQSVNELSPKRTVVVRKSDHVVGSPDWFDTAAQDSSDSPLLVSQLCSHAGDEDDPDRGFVDLDTLEETLQVAKFQYLTFCTTISTDASFILNISLDWQLQKLCPGMSYCWALQSPVQGYSRRSAMAQRDILFELSLICVWDAG